MILKFANGAKTVLKNALENENGMLRGRVRPVLDIVFSAEESEFANIRAQLANAAQLEALTLYYHGEDTVLTQEQLEGVAQKQFTGYTIVGEIAEKDVVVTPGTATAMPVYGKELTAHLGQRWADEVQA